MRPVLAALVTLAAAPFAAAAPSITAPPAAASVTPPAAEFSLAAPVDPLTGPPGATLDTWVAVGNTTGAPASIELRQARLVAGLDGRLDVDDRPDPLWAGQVTVPPRVDLEPGGYRQIPVQVRLPAAATPNLYLIGLLAQPQPRAGGAELSVHTQIVTYLAVDVPGPRLPDLAVTRQHTPRIAFSRRLHGTAQVTNRGPVTSKVRGQVRVGTRTGRNLATVPAGGDTQLLLPAGTERTLHYQYQAPGLLALVRPDLEIAFPTGAGQLGTVHHRGQLTLLLPPVTLALALAAAGGIVLVLRHRRRRLTDAAATPGVPAPAGAWRNRQYLRGHPGDGGARRTASAGTAVPLVRRTRGRHRRR